MFTIQHTKLLTLEAGGESPRMKRFVVVVVVVVVLVGKLKLPGV